MLSCVRMFASFVLMLVGTCCVTMVWWVAPLFFGISWWWGLAIFGGGAVCVLSTMWVDETW